MNLSALYRSMIVVHLLKIPLSPDKCYVLKTSFIEDRGHLFSKTIGISRIICCLHPLKIDQMIVFDNFINMTSFLYRND